MAGKWNRNKAKKPLETTLGTAPGDTDKGPDLAHLRRPITTSISSLKHVLTLFEKATTEVQDYITYECDVLYECRVCRTIFRSLANFILHKRKFCRGKFTSGGRGEPEVMPTVRVQVNAGSGCEEKTMMKDVEEEDKVVVLEKIDGSDVAVFQTHVEDGVADDLMKSEVMEIHAILENADAVMASDSGGIGTTKQKPKTLTCAECKHTFSTEKTLNHHVKYKHNNTCIVYPCPVCKETFSNAWSVYRHLFKVHRRTAAQVRRMRPMIHSSGIPRDQGPQEEEEDEAAVKKKKKDVVANEDNEEDQWMKNLESDKDFQRCGGCGKRFERRAALQSHSQMCTKRIAVCNTIKNRAKPEKKDKVEKAKELRGAARRKPLAIQRVIVENSRVELEETDPLSINAEEKNATAVADPLLIDTEYDVEKNGITFADITITKESEGANDIEPKQVPEIEIYTISDDEDCDRHEPNRAVQVPEEFVEYLNDEVDNFFVAKALRYMDTTTEFKCVGCNSSHMTLYRLLIHMSLHFSWFRFQCSKCPFSSFTKYDCTNHALNHHNTPNNMIANTVLLIPKWRVLCSSHDFKELAAQQVGDDDQQQQQQETMPELEAVESESEKAQETIVLEDDEMPDITAETVILSDDDGNTGGIKMKAGPSKMMVVSGRPIRNRTKSVKTVQNDFIYDLAKVLKLNDNSIKNNRTKRAGFNRP